MIFMHSYKNFTLSTSFFAFLFVLWYHDCAGQPCINHKPCGFWGCALHAIFCSFFVYILLSACKTIVLQKRRFHKIKCTSDLNGAIRPLVTSRFHMLCSPDPMVKISSDIILVQPWDLSPREQPKQTTIFLEKRCLL